MGSLTTNKRFTPKAKDFSTFYNDDNQATVNVEGIVEVAGVSDINVDMTSVTGAYLIGKPVAATNGDFTTAYASANTITLGGYPTGIAGFLDEDVEFVRQIATDGTVTATYSRDDCAMSIAVNVLTVTGAVFVNTDSFVIGTNVPRATSAGAGGAGGGSIVYTNAAGDFIATANDATKTITITGLPFTLEAIHVVGGTIKKVTVANVVEDIPLTDVAVAANVITLADADDFVATDTVYVTLIGPDKWYDRDLDNALVNVQNPNYGHYTDVEHIVEETNLGTTATADGTDTNTLNDANGAFDAENIAVGFDAYSEEEDVAVEVLSITDAANIETVALTDWTGDTYWLPECMRFEIPAESYNYMSIHARLTVGDANNRAHMKIYGTNDADADTTDDTYWVDLSTDVLGAATFFADGVAAAGATASEDIFPINEPVPLLKYMIKIVGEVVDGGGAAAAVQTYDVYIKKGS